jgi:drug/metabolite transporter (DMT)-like permease
MLADLMPIFFGLASAFSWGSGDFVGGLASKHVNVLTVILVSQSTGLVVLTLLGLLSGEPTPDIATSMWSGAAGLAGGMGLIVFYKALATGSMSIVAPFSGVVSAMVPVILAVHLEGPPTTLQFIGFIIAIAGVGLATGFEKSTITSSRLFQGLLAGIGFGLFLVFIGQVDDVYFFWPLTISRCITVAACFLIALYNAKGFTLVRGIFPLLVLGGLMDTGGSGFYLLARQSTRLDVSAVLSSLYPVATVILAYLVLRETPKLIKIIGIALAIAAIPLIKNTST